MAEDNGDAEDEEEPAVQLGEGPEVEGAPLGRIASRLSWPQERSEIVRKEGDSVIRTPDGPQTLGALLDDVDVTYFARRQDFVASVRSVIGDGPVPTSE